MQSFSFEQEVAKLIVETLKVKVDPSSIAPEAALFNEGLGLDSIDALELALAISQTYGYQLKSSDPDIKEHFSSLRALTKAIEKHRTK
ncbi:MAG TPA: phosphopantetheine-binding protein [Nitrospira sp.]|jgi:acyl carrier protein